VERLWRRLAGKGRSELQWDIDLPEIGFWDVILDHLRRTVFDNDLRALFDADHRRAALAARALIGSIKALAPDPYRPPAQRLRRADGVLDEHVVFVDAGPWRAFVILDSDTSGGRPKPLATAFVTHNDGSAPDDELSALITRLREAGVPGA